MEEAEAVRSWGSDWFNICNFWVIIDLRFYCALEKLVPQVFNLLEQLVTLRH
jgi:hypothetical protein